MFQQQTKTTAAALGCRRPSVAVCVQASAWMWTEDYTTLHYTTRTVVSCSAVLCCAVLRRQAAGAVSSCRVSAAVMLLHYPGTVNFLAMPMPRNPAGPAPPQRRGDQEPGEL